MKEDFREMIRSTRRFIPKHFQQFLKFCLVGGSGVIVDMAILYCLVRGLAWNVTISKICAAEVAMLNNFLWNEIWTFRTPNGSGDGRAGWPGRLLKFHAICGIGIGLVVILLHIFYTTLGMNLYLANLLAIVVTTLWNFSLNAVFNWHVNNRK